MTVAVLAGQGGPSRRTGHCDAHAISRPMAVLEDWTSLYPAACLFTQCCHIPGQGSGRPNIFLKNKCDP